MDTLRFCPHGGTTVSGNLLVPSDPADYRHRRVPVFVGCNHLVCSECGQAVRQARNLEVEGLYSNLADLNASDDWASLDCTSEGFDVRLYACACRGWLETHMHLMNDPDPDPDEDPELPWRCQGHPPPTLPSRLDGAELPDDASVLSAAGASLGGSVPPDAPAPSNFVPTIWLGRLYGYVEGTPVAQPLAEAIAAGLGSDDPSLVGSALRFFVRFPRAKGFEAVLELAERVGMATTFPSPYGDRTIDRQVGDAVLSRASSGEGDTLDTRALAMTLAALTVPGIEIDNDLCRQLVGEHAEWASHNAVAIVQAEPRRLGALMYGLKDAEEPAYEVVAGVALASDESIDGAALERLLDGSYWRSRPSTPVILGALAKR